MSTQTQHPWRAALRTAVQVGIPTILLLGVVVPEVVAIILEETGSAMPDQLRAVLLAASAVAVTTATILARVMAIPRVDELVRRFLPFLAPEPQGGRDTRDAPRLRGRHRSGVYFERSGSDPSDIFEE